jgi:peptidyl-prolyl cis-trans isomerase B (cyclophilin B)
MAKTQSDPPGASGSQFFIVIAANATQSAGLTPDYALLGKVVTGESIVDAIGSLPTNPPQDGTPTPTVVMSSVTVSVS